MKKEALPFKQEKKEGKLIREFSQFVDIKELHWHKVIKGDEPLILEKTKL